MFRVSDWLPVPHSFTQVEQPSCSGWLRKFPGFNAQQAYRPASHGIWEEKRGWFAQEQGSSNDEKGIAVSHEIGLGLHRVVQRGGQRGLALETRFDVYRRIMEIDFFAPLRLTQLLLPAMVERRGGAGSPWSVPSQAGFGVTAYIILLAFMSIPE